MSNSSETDESLLQRLLQGEEKAFVRIYDRYWYPLCLSCYRRVKDKAVAEELVQQLFLTLWQKREFLKINQLENYLFSSIRNATIDHLNRQIVANKCVEYKRAHMVAERNTTDEMVNFRDLEEALEKGLQALSGKSERVYRLYKMDNWSIDEIAAHLNLSKKTVHYHLTRSRKFIRSYLHEFTLMMLVVVLF